MVTNFIVELVLSGHDVFLLEDEETHGRGASLGYGNGACGYDYGDYGAGVGSGSGWGNGYGICSAAGDRRGQGFGIGDAFGDTFGDPILGALSFERKEKYGYCLPG